MIFLLCRWQSFACLGGLWAGLRCGLHARLWHWLSTAASEEELDHLFDHQQGQRERDADQPLAEGERGRAKDALEEAYFGDQEREQKRKSDQSQLAPLHQR